MRKVMMQAKKNRWQGYYIVNDDGECIARTCSVCHVEKTTNRFGKNSRARYGIGSACKSCNADKSKSWRETIEDDGTTRGTLSRRRHSNKNMTRTDDLILAEQIARHPDGTKTCNKCDSVLVLGEFNVCRSNVDGLQRSCRACTTNEMTEYYNRLSTAGIGLLGAEKRRLAGKRNSLRSYEKILLDRDSLLPDGRKKCSKCRDTLPLRNFWSNSWTGDGLHSRCKMCGKNDEYHRYFEEYWESIGIPLECYVCQGDWDHADHVIPSRLQGEDSEESRLPICSSCNSSKWSYPLEIWLLSGNFEALEVLDRVGRYGVDHMVPLGDYDGIVIYRDEHGSLRQSGLDRNTRYMLRSSRRATVEENEG